MYGLASVLLVLFPCPAFGQGTGTDYQLRVLFHHQAVSDGKKEGFVVWGIVPDLTQHDPFRALGVAGFVRKGERGWVEFMGGGFVDDAGKIDPVLNLRALQRAGRVLVYAEAMHTFPAERFLVSFAVTVPVVVGRLKFGVGVESDLIRKPRNGSSYGGGPRLVVPVPWLKNASLATAYQWQSKRSFLRQYLLINF
ncbi:MAG: hypothetical protein AAB686_02520 [Patescibacteria group bacterium]